MVQEIRLPHLPSEHALYVAQYKDVENAAFLRDQLIAGNADFEYAFLDASMILSTSHLLAAAFRAINDSINQRLKSRNVHSEIVYCLSPNNNIAESFRRFGVSETTKDLIVIKVATSAGVTLESVQQHVDSAIKGTAVKFNDENIKAVNNIPKIKKAYKLSNFGAEDHKKSRGAINGITATVESDKDLEIAIVGTMALRGAT